MHEHTNGEENGAKESRGMESIRDTEDDAGPVFKRSRLAGAATYGTKYSIRATNFT